MTINQSALLKSLKNNGVLAAFEKDAKKINERLASGINERELARKPLGDDEEINMNNGFSYGAFVWVECSEKNCKEKMYLKVFKKSEMKNRRCSKHK